MKLRQAVFTQLIPAGKGQRKDLIWTFTFTKLNMTSTSSDIMVYKYTPHTLSRYRYLWRILKRFPFFFNLILKTFNSWCQIISLHLFFFLLFYHISLFLLNCCLVFLFIFCASCCHFISCCIFWNYFSFDFLLLLLFVFLFKLLWGLLYKSVVSWALLSFIFTIWILCSFMFANKMKKINKICSFIHVTMHISHLWVEIGNWKNKRYI